MNTPADTGDRLEAGSGAATPAGLAVACAASISLMERLAAFVGSRHGTSANPVDEILSLLADGLEAGAVALARTVDGLWRIERLRARVDMDLQVGDSLPSAASDGVIAANGSLPCLVVEDLGADVRFRASGDAAVWQAGALTAVPLEWEGGRSRGALCTFYPSSRTAPSGEIPLLYLAGHLIVEMLEAACRSDHDRLRAQQLARYAAVAAASDDAIIGTDATGSVEIWSPGAERMFGYTAGEILGTEPRLLITPAEYVDAAVGISRQVRAGQHIDHYESVCRRRDGSRFDASFTISPIDDELGGVIGFAIAARDISALKRGKAAVAASEQQFRDIFERAPIGMVTVDAGGNILLANAALQRILGYDAAELSSMTFMDVTHPDDRAADFAQFEEILAGTRDAYTMDKRLTHKAGSVVWGQLSVSASRDAGGAVRSIVGMLLNVTERHMAEETLAESEARFRALTEHSGDVTRILDVDGTIRYASASQKEVLGIDPEDVVGHTSFEFMDPEVVPRARATLASVVATGRIQLLVSRTRHADGSYHTFEAVMQNRLDDPAVRGIVITSRDVTARVEAERALEEARAASEQLAALQSDFVARVSHELRTPLTAIIGFGELLQAHWEEFSEARRLERIGQIVLAANRQQRLVDDLLLVSRLDAARMALQYAAVSLPSLLKQVAAELQIGYPGQKIIFEGPPGLSVWADAARAAQVLTNLLDNAAKYSPEGSAIAITWELEGKRAVIRVSDHGPGIPESSRQQLFTRFGRVAGSRIRAGHVGTGLGLYISRGLAEAMSGDLDLEHSGAHGSAFRLRLPLAADEHEPCAR